MGLYYAYYPVVAYLILNIWISLAVQFDLPHLDLDINKLSEYSFPHKINYCGNT